MKCSSWARKDKIHMIEKISFMQDIVKNAYYQLPFLLDVSTIYNDTVEFLENFVKVLGAAIAIWGGLSISEGIFDSNPSNKSIGIKFFIAGGAIILIGVKLIPKLKDAFALD